MVLVAVLAVLTVGGLAYYAGKSSNKLPENEIGENNYQPVQQNQNEVANNPTQNPIANNEQ